MRNKRPTEETIHVHFSRYHARRSSFLVRAVRQRSRMGATARSALHGNPGRRGGDKAPEAARLLGRNRIGGPTRRLSLQIIAFGGNFLQFSLGKVAGRLVQLAAQSGAGGVPNEGGDLRLTIHQTAQIG